MRQVFQDLRTGEIFLQEVPRPMCLPHHVVLKTTKSLISAGTERALMEFGKAGYLGKARQQPERVKQAFDKMKTDGLGPTVSAINTKLDSPMALGYSSVGQVVESMASGFMAGRRVVANGSHAEFGRASGNLCALIPDNVSDEAAAFTVIGAIALQGIRLLNPTLGETYVVYGAGLIGLVAIQILLANGCRVLAVDQNLSRCNLAEALGATKTYQAREGGFLEIAHQVTGGLGVDGVLVTTNTSDNEVIHNSAEVCRKRARIILIGLAGLILNRDDFYKKELLFQVSSSYGPGRYDSNYENKGHVYPAGFVRWTARGNFETVLNLMAIGKISTKLLTSGEYEVDDVSKAYKRLANGKDLGILLNYSSADSSQIENKKISLKEGEGVSIKRSIQSGQVVAGAIGAGAYATRFLFPTMKKSGVRLHTIVSSGGATAAFQGNKFGFKYASTDIQDIFDADEINSVVIATPHNQHASQVISGLHSGKNIFVEKPLALKLEEIEEIERALIASKKDYSPRLMVGFNRRFSTLTNKVKEILPRRTGPMFLTYTINSGQLTDEHWMGESAISGGRLIGEVCHFLDLLCYLVDSPVIDSTARAVPQNEMQGERNLDVCITLAFADGSVGNINYLTSGSRRYPKERLEIFRGGGVLQLSNFRRLKGYEWPGFFSKRLVAQDKGNQQCLKHFFDCIVGDHNLAITFEEIKSVSRLAIKISEKIGKIVHTAD